MKLRKIKGSSSPSLGVGSNAMHAFVPGTAYVFRASGRDTQLWTFRGEKVELGGSQRDDPSAVAVSADGKLGAIGFRKGAMRVVDLEKRKTVKQWSAGKSVVENVFFAGGEVVSCCDTLAWWTPQGKKVGELKCKPFRADAAATGAIALITWSAGVGLVPPGERRMKSLGEGTGLDVGISADGSRIVALQHADPEGYELRVFDGGSGEKLAEWKVEAERVLAVTNERVVVIRNRGDHQFLDAYSLKGKVLEKLKAPGDALDAAPAYDGAGLLALGKRYALDL